MLLPLTQLIRRSASEEPERRLVGIDPGVIARAEPANTEGQCLLFCDGTDKPYLVEATVEEIIGAVHLLQEQEADECEPEPSDIE